MVKFIVGLKLRIELELEKVRFDSNFLKLLGIYDVFYNVWYDYNEIFEGGCNREYKIYD